MFRYQPNKHIGFLNKFEKYVYGKEYATKLDALEDAFKYFGEISVRDIVNAPFYYNCGYSEMRNLSKRGVNFTKEVVIIDSEKQNWEVYKLVK